jgi:polyhydroxyalkanoate synthase
VRDRVDSYVIGGATDHITPWKVAYKSARILGDNTTFVLSNNGHLQSLLNPPTNKKASYTIGPINPAANPTRRARGRCVRLFPQS